MDYSQTAWCAPDSTPVPLTVAVGDVDCATAEKWSTSVKAVSGRGIQYYDMTGSGSESIFISLQFSFTGICSVM